MTSEARGVLETLKTYLDSLASESDRGVALAVAAAFEEELGTILRAHMIEGKESDALLSGVLASFASRIGACHALGLIDTSQRSALTSIREIRNLFAHRWISIDFGTPEIDGLVRTLPLTRPTTYAAARDHFTAAVSELLFLLIEQGRRTRRAVPTCQL